MNAATETAHETGHNALVRWTELARMRRAAKAAGDAAQVAWCEQRMAALEAREDARTQA